MSINTELLGNSFIKALFILLFVNQIICLTCGLLGLLQSFLSPAERGQGNLIHMQGHPGPPTCRITALTGPRSVSSEQIAPCYKPVAYWTLIDSLITLVLLPWEWAPFPLPQAHFCVWGNPSRKTSRLVIQVQDHLED